MKTERMVKILTLFSGLLAVLLLLGSSINTTAQPQVNGVTLTAAKYVSGFVGNAGTGDIDLYTAPAGRRAFLTLTRSFNGSGVSITWFLEMKSAGVYTRLSSSTTTTSPNLQAIAFQIVLEPGQAISVNTSGSGMNVSAYLIEFDAGVMFRTVSLSSFIAGDNTLYTVPACRTSVLNASFTLSATTGTLSFSNSSGALRTIKTNIVPSGGSAGSSNQYITTTSPTNNVVVNIITTVVTMNPGDFISLNSDANTAGQFAWVNVAEIQIC